MQYSKCRLTRLVYEAITVSFDLSTKLRFIIPSILLLFFTAAMHHLSHFKGLLTIIPKFRSSLTPSS